MKASIAEGELKARYSRRRSILFRVLRPPLPLIHNAREKNLPTCDGVKLFLGGAGGSIPAGYLNIDMLEMNGVDVVADVARLPFRTGCIAAVECDAILEHVAECDAAVAEIFRVLRPGGFVHVLVPFCQAFHAYPSDYRRWTIVGLKLLFSRFEVLDSGLRAGPTATLLSFVLEYLKLPFSGSTGRGVYAIAAWILWPLRYVDLWLNRKPQAHVLAHAIYLLARKPSTQA